VPPELEELPARSARLKRSRRQMQLGVLNRDEVNAAIDELSAADIWYIYCFLVVHLIVLFLTDIILCSYRHSVCLSV
jgi:hypothetical protein